MNTTGPRQTQGSGATGPLVSVILPTHNRAQLLGRAIHSVLTQSYPNLELHVIDDCSNDDTAEVVRRFSDSRLRYTRLKQNKRAAAARNVGIDQAKGELIAFQDDDDIWLTEKLARQVPALLAAGADGGLNLCGKIRLYADRAEYVGGADAFARVDFSRGGPLDGFGLISTPAWLVTKRVLRAAGAFDETMKSWDDWELALRLSRFCTFSHLDEPLYIQDRVAGGGMWKNEAVYANDMKVILRKHPGLWANRRSVLSRSYYVLGRSEAMFDDSRRGRRWLLRAVRTDLLNGRAWAMLMLSFGGTSLMSKVFEVARRLRVNLHLAARS